MEETESDALLRLRPVSFEYCNDTVGIRQCRLIAEEVARVLPELVQYSDAGAPQIVNYHFLPPLILKQLQRQQEMIDRQNDVKAGLEARLGRLGADRNRKSARSRRMRKPAPRLLALPPRLGRGIMHSAADVP